jgi:hypothetical protein
MDADVSAVEQRAAALLDDPSMSVFTGDYLRPYINQVYDDFLGEVSSLGLEFAEESVIINVPAGIADLQGFVVGDSQPLARMREPKYMDWRPAGAKATDFLPVPFVDKLDDFDPNITRIAQFDWVGGIMHINLCAIDVDLRITFESMSPSLYDPAQEVVRGVTNILAYNVAAIVFDLRENARMALKYERKADEALCNFKSTVIGEMQTQTTRQRSAHPRRRLSLGSLIGCTTTSNN